MFTRVDLPAPLTPTMLTISPSPTCEIFPPDDFPLYFYRQPKAPDLEIDAPEGTCLPVRDVESLDLKHVACLGRR